MKENSEKEKPNILITLPCEENSDFDDYDPCESNEDITEIDLAVLLKQEAAKLLEQKKKAEEAQKSIYSNEEKAKLWEIKTNAQKTQENISQYDKETKPQELQINSERSPQTNFQNEKEAKSQEQNNLKERLEDINQNGQVAKAQEQKENGDEKQGIIIQNEVRAKVNEVIDILEEIQEIGQKTESDIKTEQIIETESDVLLNETISDLSKIDAAVWQDTNSVHSFQVSEDSEEEKYLKEERKTRKRVCKKIIKNPFFTNRLQFQSQQLCPPPLTPPLQKLPPVPEVDSVGSIVCRKGDNKKRYKKKKDNAISVTANAMIEKPKSVFKSPETKRNIDNIIKKTEMEKKNEKVQKRVEVKTDKRTKNFQRNKNIEEKEELLKYKQREKTENVKKDENKKQNEIEETEKVKKGEKTERHEKLEISLSEKRDKIKKESLSEKLESTENNNEKSKNKKLKDKIVNQTEQKIQYNFDEKSSQIEPFEVITEDNLNLTFETQSLEEIANDTSTEENNVEKPVQSTVAKREKKVGEFKKQILHQNTGTENKRRHCERRERLPCRKKVSEISISLLPPQIPPLQRDLPPTCPKDIPEFQRQLHMAVKNKGKTCKKKMDQKKK